MAKVLLEAKADPFAQDGVGMVLSSRDVSWCIEHIYSYDSYDSYVTKYIIRDLFGGVTYVFLFCW